MRKIYIAKIPPVYAPVTYECYCRKVDEERLAKVRHIRPDQSRMGCLLAGCLLQWAVKEWLADQEGFADESAQPDKDMPIDQEVFNEKEMPTNQEGSLILAPFWIKSVEIEEMVSPPLPLNYGYGGGGKPYLSDQSEFYYNLSHSGPYAICGVDRGEIGVDIQEETPVEEQLAERFFTADEAEAIKALPDEAARRALFFRMWSVKESFIKLTGQGMKRGLDSFCINWEKGLIEEFSGKELARFRVCEVEPAVHLAVCYYA